MSSLLVGKNILLLRNDFIDKDLSARVAIADIDKNILLLELDNSEFINNEEYKRVVVSTRLSSQRVEDVLVDGVLGCSATWVPNSKYDNTDPLNLNWWRGGAAAVTSIRIK